MKQRTRRLQTFMLAAAMVAVLCVSTSALAATLPDFADLAAKAGPAVVNINTEKSFEGNVFGQWRDLSPNTPQDMPSNELFNRFRRFFEQHPQAHKQRSLGSGFIVSSDGYIVTNNHVIANADVVSVSVKKTDNDSETFQAIVVGTDPETDLALLKIDAKRPLATLQFGDSDALRVGEWVMAIGNPLGFHHSVTAGIVSALGRNIRSGAFDDFIQTDASINLGNSGGPLLNAKGNVIGINTAIAANGQGIGFAVPSNLASRVIEMLKTNKRVARGWIGVSIQDLDANSSKALGLQDSKGALIASVLNAGPAEKAGLRAGDVIIEVDQTSIADASELLRTIANITPGKKARLTVMRDGKQKTFTLTLGERGNELAKSQIQQHPQVSGADALGLKLRQITEEEARRLRLTSPEGLLVTSVQQNSPAATAGMQPGDVVLSANFTPVSSVAQLQKILQGDVKRRGAVMLQIYRDGSVFIKALPLE